MQVTYNTGMRNTIQVGAQFPKTRMRRRRQSDWARRLIAENHLRVDDLIWPIFVIEGEKTRTPVTMMPGVSRLTIDLAIEAAVAARDIGIPVLALFPNTPSKLRTPNGEEAYNPDNLICRAVRAIKRAVPDIGILCDVALDPYTSHGHDGLLEEKQGTHEIINDLTLDVLVQQALVQRAAGCDIIAPSDMMDGRIAAIRAAFEAHDDHNALIMAYSAKYASAFYGPFRDAVGSSGHLKGDKRSYQMDFRNGDEALHELALDIAEGADMVMIKPGMPYLDIVGRCKDAFKVPTFAYQVSGEYAMIATAAEQGYLERDDAVLESLIGFKRAGADGVLTYFALEAAHLLAA